MKRHAYGITVLALAAALAGAGCTVEQTDEGEMPDVSYQDGELPDVDIEGGDLPEYDVDWVNVDVGVTRKTVTVPTVDVSTEEREISVPYLNFTLPDADREVELRERTITVALDVPGPGYDLEIEEIRLDEGTLIVISRLDTPDAGVAGGAGTRVADRVVVNAPDLEVEHWVVGERPPGVDADYEFVTSKPSVPASSRIIYSS